MMPILSQKIINVKFLMKSLWLRRNTLSGNDAVSHM